MYFNQSYQARQSEIVSDAFGDVNGDGVVDYVFLTAIKSSDPDSPFVKDIKLNIQDGATKVLYILPLDQSGNSGYSPSISLKDFTGDELKEILITIDSGGSGALTFDFIYSFRHNHMMKLFDFNQYNEENQYQVQFLDQFKVEIKSPATNLTYYLDISHRGEEYLSQIYDEKGKLKMPVQGMSDGISGFYPVDLDRDGVYEIQAYQKISGLYHADSFGYIINTLQWDGERFFIWQQWFAMYGTESKSE